MTGPKRQVGNSDTTIIIPTLNEGKNIGVLLDLLEKQYPGIKVIVADDGSTDNTQTIVKSHSDKNKNIMLLDRSRAKTKGITASVIHAINETDTENVVVIDGDMQHPPEKIKELVEALKQFDIVGAARKKVLVKWPLHRRIISHLATTLARIRLGKSISDPLSGFFGAKTQLFKSVLGNKEPSFEKEGYKVFFDLLKYIPRQTRIGEIHYDFGLRKGGESKIKAKHIIIFFRSLFK